MTSIYASPTDERRQPFPDAATTAVLDGIACPLGATCALATPCPLGYDCPKLASVLPSDDAARDEHILTTTLRRPDIDAITWGERFIELAELRGVELNRRGRKPNGDNSATVAELAAEFNVDDRTARWRVEAANLPADLKQNVRAGDISISAALQTAKSPDPNHLLGGASLAERFIVPPFTVLDTRQGYWQQRKRAWALLGVRSELGRDAGLTYNIKQWAEHNGKSSPYSDTSIFDPVLTELCYAWFTRPGHHVLDPFAGGSVRGIVAALMGRRYTGIDLCEKQINANREQWEQIRSHLRGEPPAPQWIVGDARDVLGLAPGGYDYVFTCPPYYNLEIYSDDPADLCNADDYGTFLADYGGIIAASCSMLRPNRFAAVVVGDVRDKRGFLHNFSGDTVNLFERAGRRLYNHAVLIEAIGSLALRAAKPMNGTRKLGKCHQDVLVFFGGDPRLIRETLGELGDECRRNILESFAGPP